MDTLRFARYVVPRLPIVAYVGLVALIVYRSLWG